jgi:Pvc16 N-terminal domain
VLADVDASLAAWLSAELPAGTTIDFAPPAGLVDHRRSGRSARTVNLFLHDIVADPSGMAAAPVYQRDDRGRVRSVQQPLRRFRLSYLVTAWAPDTQDEHRLLGQVLAAQVDALAGEQLHGSLRELNLPIPVELGGPGRGGEPLLWASLGLPARASVELTATATVPPGPQPGLPPSVQKVELGMREIDGVAR